MIVRFETDSRAWQEALDVLLEASQRQMREATLQGAEEIRDEAKGLLTLRWHAWDTFTPSEPGDPPAAISGRLAESMKAEMVSLDEAWVGPTDSASSRNGPYGRIQEIGGLMQGHPLMHFFAEGRWWEREEIFLEPRPYLKPATESVVDSGRLTDIYVQHQLQAILEATG